MIPCGTHGFAIRTTFAFRVWHRIWQRVVRHFESAGILSDSRVTPPESQTRTEEMAHRLLSTPPKPQEEVREEARASREKRKADRDQ
jgi:hypothetical protein